MQVRMMIAVSGTRDGEPWPPVGGTVDLPDEEARHMCAAGLARAVEMAVTPAADHTGLPKPEKPETVEPEKRGRGRPRKTTGG